MLDFLEEKIHDWNRIYGKRGFTQYQFIIPKESAARGLPQILDAIAASGQGSFLAVLKLCGQQETYPGNISFPAEGYTLALDFAMNDKLFPLLDRLDAMAPSYGGRHCPHGDHRLSARTLALGYGQAVEEFRAVKARLDPDNMFSSLQSRRLDLEV